MLNFKGRFYYLSFLILRPFPEPEIRILQFTVYSPKTFPKAFQLCPVQFGLKNVPIQRVFMGKKTPFLYAIVFNNTKGHSGRQTTPIDPCQRTFKGFSRTKLSRFQSKLDTISIRILRPFSEDKVVHFYGQLSETFPKDFYKLSASKRDPNSGSKSTRFRAQSQPILKVISTYFTAQIYNLFQRTILTLQTIPNVPFLWDVLLPQIGNTKLHFSGLFSINFATTGQFEFTNSLFKGFKFTDFKSFNCRFSSQQFMQFMDSIVVCRG